MGSTENALEYAWGKAQHGRAEWTGADEVTLIADPEAVRSSCIGDVFVICAAGEHGDGKREAYQIDFEGFSKIDGRRSSEEAPDHPIW